MFLALRRNGYEVLETQTVQIIDCGKEERNLKCTGKSLTYNPIVEYIHKLEHVCKPKMLENHNLTF